MSHRIVDDKVIQYREWSTPATYYPVSKLGKAEIRRSKYSRGYYHMHGIRGKLFFQAMRPIPVTSLYIAGEEWMVDDPLHWLGTCEYSDHVESPALVAGLGLGLVVHHLVERGVSFTVVEQSQDVINLIAPLLPKRATYRIVHAPFEHYVMEHGREFGWLYWDLAVGDAGTPDVSHAFSAGIAYWRAFMPQARAVFFGAENPRTGKVWYPNGEIIVPRHDADRNHAVPC